jgi:hypothetical protein
VAYNSISKCFLQDCSACVARLVVCALMNIIGNVYSKFYLSVALKGLHFLANTSVSINDSCIKHRASYLSCTLGAPNTNFYIMEWNFIYKMWIFQESISLILFVHMSIQVKYDLLWETYQLRVMFGIINWLKVPITEMKSGCKERTQKLLAIKKKFFFL